MFALKEQLPNSHLQERPLHGCLIPPATPSWAPGTVQPTLLPHCLSSSQWLEILCPGIRNKSPTVSLLQFVLSILFLYLAWLFGMIPFAHFSPYLVSKTSTTLLRDADEKSLLEQLPLVGCYQWAQTEIICDSESQKVQMRSFSSQAQFKEAVEFSKLLFFHWLVENIFPEVFTTQK